jgi:hypothetical protein
MVVKNVPYMLPRLKVCLNCEDEHMSATDTGVLRNVVKKDTKGNINQLNLPPLRIWRRKINVDG